VDDDVGESERGWVERTEKVHLDSDSVEEGYAVSISAAEREKYREQYNQLLGRSNVLTKLDTMLMRSAGLLPPPFRIWGKYYIVPASLLSTLKTLALDDASKSSVSPSDLRIDLSSLLKDGTFEPVAAGAAGGALAGRKSVEEVFSIGSGLNRSTGGDARELRPFEGRKEKLWSVKEGLVENEDFLFVPMGAWNLLTTW
jgi:hypothetical protein